MPINIWRNLFDRLAGGREVPAHKPWIKSKILSHLRELGLANGPFRVDWIFHWLFHNDPQVCEATADLIRSAMRRVHGREWFDQYERFRHIELRKKDVKKLAVFPVDTAVHLVGIASLNSRGYVREAALDAFSRMSQPEMIPYVLLRLSDWVDPVREKATTLFHGFLPDLDVSAIASFRHIFERLNRVERLDMSPIHRNIAEHLSRPDTWSDLIETLPDFEERTRFFIWRTIKEVAVGEPGLKCKILDDSSAMVRAWAVGLLEPGDWTDDLAEGLLTDRSSKVRLRALQMLPVEKMADFQGRIRKTIFDDSRPVREMACWLLKQQGETDFAAMYRNRLPTNAAPGVIAGLGEAGNAEDIDLVAPFLNHDRLKIRAAALVAIYHLNPDAAVAPALIALEDSGNRVRRIAANILMAVREQRVKPDLREILLSGHPRARPFALRVLVHYGGFGALGDILSAINDPNDAVVYAGWNQLIRWHGRYSTRMYSQPGKETLARLTDRIKDTRSRGIEPPGPAAFAWQDLPGLLGISDI